MALAAQQWPQIGQGEVARPVWEIVSLPESLGGVVASRTSTRKSKL